MSTSNIKIKQDCSSQGRGGYGGDGGVGGRLRGDPLWAAALEVAEAAAQ